MPNRAGTFIVIDGGEGCGKSSQADKVCARLREIGIPHIHVREPGSTNIGEAIRAVLLNTDHVKMSPITETLLFMAARRELIEKTIIPNLDEGNMVISDRFVSSTYAYQTCEDLPKEKIEQITRIVCQECMPDLTIILDVDYETAEKRIGERTRDRIEQKSPEFHRMVRKRFLEQVDNKTVFKVDGTQSEQEVFNQIMKLISRTTLSQYD